MPLLSSLPVTAIGIEKLNTFCFRAFKLSIPSHALEESISGSGLLSPVILTKDLRILDGRTRLEIASKLGIEEISVQVLPAMSIYSLFDLYINLHSDNLSLSSVELGLLIHALHREVLLDQYWYNTIRGMLNQYMSDEGMKRLSMVSSLSVEARQILHSFKALPQKVLTLLEYPLDLLDSFITETHSWGFNLNEMLQGIEQLYLGALQREIEPKTAMDTLSDYASTLTGKDSPCREDIKQYLEKWRYPIRNTINDNIRASLSLPDGVKARWDKDLERRSIEVTFTISNTDHAGSLDKNVSDGFFTSLYNRFISSIKP